MMRMAKALGAAGLMATCLAGCAEEDPANPNWNMQQPLGQMQQPMAGNNAVGQQPTGQQPTGQQPTGQQPTGQQPDPNAQDPNAQDPNAQDPNTQDPNTEDPAPQPVDWTPVCVDDPKNTVVVGDSYINWFSHSLPQDLINESGQTWDMRAVGGSSMASGGIAGFIPDQLRAALAANPDITTVLMDGGGNDILLADTLRFAGSASCLTNMDSPSLEVCQEIVDLATKTASELMDEAAASGVSEVVYFFYPHLPPAAAPGANPMLDYSMPLARESCESAVERSGGKMRCTFINMVPVFEGQSGVFAGDNIHPNNTGSALMAKKIWQTMVDNCISQPSSSGCCMPAE